mgnify:CR=1 FL=1
MVATPLGTLAAYGLFASGLPLARRLHTLMLTPIIVPVILIAIGVFYVYVQLKLVNTLAGIVLAHVLLALPLVVMVVTAALKSFDLNQERVARSLGASRATAFVTVTLPQLRFSIVSAALLSFLTSFDEVILALFIAGGGNSTLTRNMFTALRDQVDPTIAAISTLMIVVTTAGLIAAEVWGRPKR